ncbi:DUF2267 domain-containing protein [Streptomyces sp. NBC_01497]|uniref:DUF2267 domain-containing protein n=1 Tax=Streptomyces sp. NBC_01497 TaxID=2903885 RepID=UPI002E3664DF|nr:DUF2267 domain-containing protein [Streptomyces sp. NBC_01497]
MQLTSQQAPSETTMSYTQMLERVRYNGAYPTRERAEAVTADVLTALGRQLTHHDRVDLAAHLPHEAARILTAQNPGTQTQSLTGWAFVKDLATRTGGTPATTRWDVGSVLGVVAHLAGPTVDHILTHLPSGYAILFGRAELLQAA